MLHQKHERIVVGKKVGCFGAKLLQDGPADFSASYFVEGAPYLNSHCPGLSRRSCFLLARHSLLALKPKYYTSTGLLAQSAHGVNGEKKLAGLILPVQIVALASPKL